MTKQPFVHFRLHTEYSLSEGAIKIKNIPELCSKNNMPAVAITDTNNMFGAMQFSTACSKKGVQPILGCQLNILSGSGQNNTENTGAIALYAKNEQGKLNLFKLISDMYLRAENPHSAFVTLDDLKLHNSGLLALTGGSKSILDGYCSKLQNDKAEHWLSSLQDIFKEDLFLELQRHGLPEQATAEPLLLDLAHKKSVPLIATNDCYFDTRSMHEAHDALLCIASSSYVEQRDRRKETPEHYFKSGDEMRIIFEDVPEAIDNTLFAAKKCSTYVEYAAPMLPKFAVENTEGGEEISEAQLLRKMSEDGLRERLSQAKITDESKVKSYFDRLEYELSVINGMEFDGYFLIVSDFIKWAKEQKIPVGPGRGSGAGSIVAWSLLITDVDPLEYGLIFERFLNPERVSMPDFDIDFCQERREEVIQYVKRKYGADRVAQIVTFGKLQAKAVLRDVGRVLGMSYPEVEAITRMVPFNPVNPVTLQDAIDMDPNLRKTRDEDPRVKKLLDIGLKLEGLSRHTSTHAAGVVIGNTPLHETAPLYSDPRSDMPVIQYSMKDAESAGLVKFDFLGLKTLTLIDKTLSYIADTSNRIDITEIPLDDLETYKMLSKGDTTGVFQLDSSLVKDAIRKMRPDGLLDIVALTSLCRPGPMENIPHYNDVKHGRKKADYPHEKLKEVLEETNGLMVYQEQVLLSARVLAGYSLGSADFLRKAMGKKIKSEMDEQRQIFVKGCHETNNVAADQANKIFDHMAKFAGYGFNKAHATCYALIAYQTAYLRRHYPVQFFTACMNIDIGDTDKLGFFAAEAKSMGIKILPPNINSGYANFSVTKYKDTLAICYGLSAIKGAGEKVMKALQEERTENGNYKDVFDLLSRVKDMGKKNIEGLAKAGAFIDVYKDSSDLVHSCEILARFNQLTHKQEDTNQHSLFGGSSETELEVTIPNIEQYSWTKDEKVLAEYQALGFFLSNHPLENFKEDMEAVGVIASDKFEDKITEKEKKIYVAGIVATKTIRSGKRGRFGFLKISDVSGVYEIMMYDDNLISDASEKINSTECLVFTVKASRDEGGIKLSATSIDYLRDKLPTMMNNNQPRKLILSIKDAGMINFIAETLKQKYSTELAMDTKITIKCHDTSLDKSYSYDIGTHKISQSIKDNLYAKIEQTT